MNELVVRDDAAIMPKTFEGMLAQAAVLVKSGLLPVSIKTPESALAVMLAGREMGIPPMQSFRSLYVVNQQVTMAAQHMAAKLIQAGITYAVRRMTADVCEIDFARGNGMSLTYVYTMDEAKTAGLTGKDNWRHFPKDMLWNRCMALGARKIAPDVLAGMYTPDELGAELVDPEIIDAQPVELEALPEPAPEAAQQEPDVRPAWRDKGNQRWFHGRLGEMAITHDEAKRLLANRLGRKLAHFEDCGMSPKDAVEAIKAQFENEIGDEQASEVAI